MILEIPEIVEIYQAVSQIKLYLICCSVTSNIFLVKYLSSNVINDTWVVIDCNNNLP